MNPFTTCSRTAVLALAMLAAWTTGTTICRATDRFDSAVSHAGRSEADARRDLIDHPAELLRLSGIKPGAHVADVLAGDGYFSELLGTLVGSKGRVTMINNPAFDRWTETGRRARLAGDRLPNVEYRVLDLDQLNLAAGSLDAIVLSKVYHDLYWIDPDGVWPRVDAGAVLDQLVQALKPGGVLLLIDHAATKGHGSADASTLHRIDEDFARQDFEKHGLHVIATSDLLRRPDDSHEQVSSRGPMLGKSDRFVLVFSKNRQ